MIVLMAAISWAGPVEDRKLIGQLDREVIALKQKVALLQTQLTTCSTATAPDPLVSELQSVLDGRPAAVTRVGPNTYVTVPLDEIFAADGLRIREEADPLVDLLSTAIKGHPQHDVTVIVYADVDTLPAPLAKTWRSSLELSAQRAALVVRAMSERFGVPAAQLTAAGRGAAHPVSSNDTPEGRYQNRRLVILFQPGVSP